MKIYRFNMWKNRKIKDPKRSEEITKWCQEHKKEAYRKFYEWLDKQLDQEKNLTLSK